MDAETAAKQFRDLHKELAATYTVVIGILARLPIPMLLPQRQADDPAGVLRSLSLAWELADWEPFDQPAIGRLRAMILEWSTAYEMSVVANGFGPAPWRLRAIELALLRSRVAARHMDHRLSRWER
jgi:hypothetical protein